MDDSKRGYTFDEILRPSTHEQYNSLNELSANEGSWEVDGCMVVYLAGWKKLNAPPSVGRPAKSRPVYIDTAVSDTKPFSCHIFASSITHRKIFNCPLCSYTGAI